MQCFKILLFIILPWNSLSLTCVRLPRNGVCSSFRNQAADHRPQRRPQRLSPLQAGMGFGSDKTRKTSKLRTGKIQKRQNNKEEPASKNTPFVKSEQNVLLERLAARAAQTELGRVVAKYNTNHDPFWELIPSLIASGFPHVEETELSRIAQFVQLHPETPYDWVDRRYRPYEELHAYMPGLEAPVPFHDPSRLSFCQELEQNYEAILQEYHALCQNHHSDRLFQSVTSMNYESGWKTLVLFYNGHRIPKFPYHLCPTTTRILESIPIAGRIAGFNRQQPETGIPEHTDGNNLWLTCQMGMDVPETAYIEVAGEQRHWENGRCMVYDTTFAHRTWNPDPVKERVVLHVDFFNTLALTKTEIAVLQYIYQLREEFMKAEGVAKVGAQVL